MKSKAIQRLYDQIPSFTCKKGCTDCCGPIPFSKAEWDEVADKRRATSEHCPYIKKGGGCEIYEQRPFMCRVFGTTEDKGLRCPHGCIPETPLTAEQASRLTKQYTMIIQLEQM